MNFLRACRGEAVDRVPVWIMRQAGRYLPAYQEVRAKHDFLTMCHTAELAAEVTLQPVREFGFDAAIIFSDILIPLEPMGMTVEFVEGKGPRLSPHLRSKAAIDGLKKPDFAVETAFLYDALGIVRRALPAETALIGFAGAPWTMACYAVEGMGSRDYAVIKQMMNTEPAVLHALLEALTEAIIQYLGLQLDAGADAVQLFDSWADALSPSDYRVFALPYIERIFAALRGRGKPLILFSKDAGAFSEMNAALPIDVLAVDWRVDLAGLRGRLAGRGPRAFQGNLDPLTLLGSREILLEKATALLDANAGSPGYIFNLGHGITPLTPVENVRALVECVHGFRMPSQ